MSKRRQFTPNLLSVGIIDLQLHYGIYARNWWETIDIESAANTRHFTVPYRLFMRVSCMLNDQEFVITVTSNDKTFLKPGFQCICGKYKSEIESYPSTAIKACYQKVFGTKTEYSGLAVMGFESEDIIQKLIANISFFPLFLRIEKFLVVITNLGNSSSKNENEYYEAQAGFTSSFITRYKGAQHLFLLKINEEHCLLEIYFESTCIQKIIGDTSDNVWSQIGIHQKQTGSYLFGIKNISVQEKLRALESELMTCTCNDWTNSQQLKKTFDRHVKSRKIPNTMIDWPRLFYEWHQQESSIVEFPLILQKIYPSNYILQEKELRAWRAMFTACGCTNVSPFSKKESHIEFWSKAPNPYADKKILEGIYKSNIFQLNDRTSVSATAIQNNTFWNSFRDGLSSNGNGTDGKIRILSIIALNFRYNDLKKELGVSNFIFISNL